VSAHTLTIRRRKADAPAVEVAAHLREQPRLVGVESVIGERLECGEQLRVEKAGCRERLERLHLLLRDAAHLGIRVRLTQQVGLARGLPQRQIGVVPQVQARRGIHLVRRIDEAGVDIGDGATAAAGRPDANATQPSASVGKTRGSIEVMIRAYVGAATSTIGDHAGV
jgi:hypothetical protein